ncbi:MAG: hypothetical protein IPP47_02250 [Bryobacterales bacterium]|nr:hypothetical protein [Bryobacterales bacterium]
MRLIAAFLLATALFAAEDQPKLTISNGLVEMKVLPPDAKGGYYQGTRFDWSGQVASLQYKGHNWFGQWNAQYDPKLHDAIMGPVEEFRTNDAGPGFDEAKPGDSFIRIGVGAVRRPDDKPYQSFRTYDIVDHGKWTVKRRADRVEFTQALKLGGYGYIYKKTLRLEKGKPVLAIEHSLRNTGTKHLQTQQYNHNFFVMDGKPTGPDASVTFAFDPRATLDLKGLAEIQGRKLVYLKELATGQSTFTQIEGYGKAASDYDLRLEHRGAGIGVHITGDQPIVKLVYWSIRSTFCPEPYIALSAEPGHEVKWKYTYEFYTLP